MNIDLVLVTFEPDLNLLDRVLGSISSQVRRVYIVDNSPIPFDSAAAVQIRNVEIITLGDNKGIAFAQNIGIKKSLDNGSDYILLSDQDTVYPRCFIEDMLASVNEDFAAISPLFNDSNQKTLNQGFVKKGLLGFEKFYPSSGVHYVFQTIASGCILNSQYLDDIGLMNEDLFIDWVDIEWCWRASYKGYRLLGNANVTISHQLGDDSVNLKFREVNIRSPFRHYFITRNAFYLALNCKELDLIHRLVLFLKSFRYLFGFPILSKPHLKHLKYTFKGFYHALVGRLGNYK
jgi:rhamnosyltransferase